MITGEYEWDVFSETWHIGVDWHMTRLLHWCQLQATAGSWVRGGYTCQIWSQLRDFNATKYWQKKIFSPNFQLCKINLDIICIQTSKYWIFNPLYNLLKTIILRSVGLFYNLKYISLLTHFEAFFFSFFSLLVYCCVAWAESLSMNDSNDQVSETWSHCLNLNYAELMREEVLVLVPS